MSAVAGHHERRLAIGAIAQQATHITATLVMLAVITALGRTLSLAEFGVYGLLVSFTSFVLIAQLSVEGSAVKALGEAVDARGRDAAFTIALTTYAAAGLLVGALVAAVGIPLVALLGVPASLATEAREGVAVLAAVMIFGWPLKTFQDVLRGNQLFVAAAMAELFAYLVFGATSILLLEAGAPLWALAGVGGSIPAFVGLASAVVVAARRVNVRFRRDALRRDDVRSFLGLSGNLFALGITDLVIYSLDRVILGAFRSAATIGLYEGPVRVHNLVRQLNGQLVLTVLPAAAHYLGQGDKVRARELLLRGTRYVTAAVVPVAVVLMILAEPVLDVWLGPRFTAGSTALAILLSYWLAASTTTVASPMLVAAGRARALVKFAVATAAANLALSLALTPSLGLEGVVIGTAVPNWIIAPLILRLGMRVFEIELGDIMRDVWIPVFSLAVPLAAGVAALRFGLDLDTVPRVAGVAIGSVLLYWVAFAKLWLKPGERILVRDLARTFTGRG
jgi:O-antigen/teichoic acid export membrane protein